MCPESHRRAYNSAASDTLNNIWTTPIPPYAVPGSFSKRRLSRLRDGRSFRLLPYDLRRQSLPLLRWLTLWFGPVSWYHVSNSVQLLRRLRRGHGIESNSTHGALTQCHTLKRSFILSIWAKCSTIHVPRRDPIRAIRRKPLARKDLPALSTTICRV